MTDPRAAPTPDETAELVTPTLTLRQLTDQLEYLDERIEDDPPVIFTDGVLEFRVIGTDYDRATGRAIITGEPL